jgi:hypothetical protein
LSGILPESLFAAPADVRVRWTDRLLVWAAVLSAWERSAGLADRFEAVRELLVATMPRGRRRPGKTYTGFAEALAGRSEALLRTVGGHLRSVMPALAGDHWRRLGRTAIAVDGSRVELPRTAANRAAFGCAGKPGSPPQLSLTTLWHMGPGVPWDFRIGPGTEPERAHLSAMLADLPADALVVADAGFTGYELLSSIAASGRSFLVRVGSAVRLLRKLGYAETEDGRTVYLWPAKNRRGRPPLVLRLIRVAAARSGGGRRKTDGRKRRKRTIKAAKARAVWLLTNLTDPADFSDADAAALYRMRWGVEVFYRSLKQTLARRTMRSASPERAKGELAWAVVGLWLLGLMAAARVASAGRDPLSWSAAAALRAVRRAMRDPAGRAAAGLPAALAASSKDAYLRRNPKAADDWPHKKTDKPPGRPRVRRALRKEILAAQRLRASTAA